MNIYRKILRARLYLLQSPRWQEYKNFIEFGLDKGYKFISMIDYYENYFEKDSDEKLVVMRHDVDNSTEAARIMFKIEKEYGIHSTFYFRWETAEKELIQEIEEEGSEASLHYQTLADMIIRDGIPEKIDDAFFEKGRDELKAELERFRKEFDVKAETVASHGHVLNSKVGITNALLLKDEILSDYGLTINCYNEQLLDSFSTYISDGNADAGGWRYAETPQEAMELGKKKILCLTHPGRWDMHFLETLLNLVRPRNA